MEPEEKKSPMSHKARDVRDEMEDLRGQRKPPKVQPSSPGVELLAEHTVVAGDSLSAIASHYYGSGTKENWMAIYEANKEIIGDNPSLIRPGQVLKIPELPAE